MARTAVTTKKPPTPPVKMGDTAKPCVRGDAIVQRVLAATIDELARVGYGALRIDDVAQRACVNKTTVYRRWPEKCALVRDALQGMSDRKPVAPETGALRSDLVAAGRTLVRLFKAPSGQSIMRMMLAEGADGELLAIKRELRRERSMIPLAALRAAVSRGELHGDADLQLLLDTLVGTVHHRIFFLREPVDLRFLERLVDMLLDGVRKPPSCQSR